MFHPQAPYPFTPEILDALIASHSPERITRYLNAVGQDREKALRLYVWNAAVSAAFYGPLQAFEVSLRNAMHRELSAYYGSASWYNDTRCQLDTWGKERIDEAKGPTVDPSQMVSRLSFGFWTSLLGVGGKLPTRVAANYEANLWIPMLRKAFPHRQRLSRREAHAQIDRLRKFRNRIAHHEPIFHEDLSAEHARILEVTGWICPHTKAWIEHHSRVMQLLNLPQDSDSVLF